MEQSQNKRPVGRFKNSNLAQAWLVLFLAMGFGAALAAVQVNLSDIIAVNKLNETLEKVPELVNADAASIKTAAGTVQVDKAGKTKTYAVYKATDDDRPAGWVVKAGGQGYADKIELLLGLDPDAQTITGLFVLEQKETPGLGNKITFADWRSQFIGKKTLEPLQVAKGKNAADKAVAIDTITGATISSRAVADIVNRTVADVKGLLTPQHVKFMQRQD